MAILLLWVAAVFRYHTFVIGPMKSPWCALAVGGGSALLGVGDASVMLFNSDGPIPRWSSERAPSRQLVSTAIYFSGWRWMLIQIPLWLIFLMCTIPTAILFYVDRARTQSGRCCVSCGYSLTGNTSGTCPECGAACSQVSGVASA